ncbi:MAG: hypothetical protein PHU36_01075 [Syntrophomonadaceae bacterium]|nr:hypothetical protein [Syntrophomonadaceae bacterium]
MASKAWGTMRYINMKDPEEMQKEAANLAANQICEILLTVTIPFYYNLY